MTLLHTQEETHTILKNISYTIEETYTIDTIIDITYTIVET